MARRDDVLKYFEEQKEYMETVVPADIEKNRKGDFSVKLDGIKDGTPVHIEQKTHKFRFGANLFLLDNTPSEEVNREYKEYFKKVFNLATLPFYWCTVEPEEGKFRYKKDSEYFYRRPPIDTCVEFCLENGIEPKCHCLNYDAQAPAWLAGKPVSYVKEKLEKRFKEISEMYSKVIPSFEVTNETLQYKHGTEFFMEDDFLEWSYRTADKYFPNNRLIINDYNVWDPCAHTRNYYYMEIENLLSKGNIHLDSIGMQYHMFFTPEQEVKLAGERYNPKKITAVTNLLSKFNKALQITEMTIPAYGNDEEGEAIQAELIRNIYSLLFAQPNMEAVIYWNLVDGYGYSDDGLPHPGDMTAGENIYYGGLVRFDMSEKPAYRMLDRLINHDWHTSLDGTVKDGKVDFRGFYGKYEITAGDKKFEISFE